MKIKFGDLTANQMRSICKNNYNRNSGWCNGCPLYHENDGCIAFRYPLNFTRYLDKEINLPDEEVEEDDD